MDSAAMPAATRCDVFCRVIDNLGDAAVSWRIARSLAREHGFKVRLLIDQPAVLEGLLQRELAQHAGIFDGVEVRVFDDPVMADASVLIETFGCGLPSGYLARRSVEVAAPVLINVEYLSAEAWVDGVHQLASPATESRPARHFFLPGFTASSGGLLREHDLPGRQAALNDGAAQRAFWQRIGVVDGAKAAPRVSMFVYDHGFGADWLDQLAAQGAPLHLIVAEGVMTGPVAAFCGSGAAGQWRRSGDFQISVVPFLAQDDFDALLYCCNGNVVRGEDSFVRAQLSGRPMLWDIYPQNDDTHLVKLDAYLQRYCAAWPAPLRMQNQRAAGALVRRDDDCAAALAQWAALLTEIGPAAAGWREHLQGLPELGSELAMLARKLLK